MLTRRRFIKLAGGAGMLVAVPALPIAGCGDNIKPQISGKFFDAHGWATIDAATAIILPATDALAVGAREARAVAYIDTLLSAFDVDPPAIFAGGPFSGRTTQPDGTAVPNDFVNFLPLSRVKEIAWRIRIFGSAATMGGDFNDALLGPTIGWRDLYTAGVMQLDAAAAQITPGAQFVDLAPVDQANALYTVASEQQAFWTALLAHTLEGTYSAPEYGGNAYTAGWIATKYDGDSAPLGHAQYDTTTNMYVDSADQPTSTASPGDTTETFSDDILDILTVAAIGSGGMKFF